MAETPKRRPRRRFDDDFKAQAVRLVLDEGKSVTEPEFFNIGLYNIGGTGAYPAPNTGVHAFTGVAEDMGRFKAPTLRNIALTAPYMHDGSVATLEDVVALYEAGRVRHVGQLPQLEDELCGLMAGGGYEGPGRSPDRADALVWALSELMLGRRSEPRVRLV